MNTEQSETQDDQKTESGAEDEPPHPTTVWEWMTLAGSILVVLIIAGALVWHAVTSSRPGHTDAQMRITAEIVTKDVRSEGSRYLIPVQVRNTGNVALQTVTVRVTLIGKDGKPDERELDFDFLAEGATEEAMVVSETPPDTAKPKTEVLSFHTRRNPRGY